MPSSSLGSPDSEIALLDAWRRIPGVVFLRTCGSRACGPHWERVDCRPVWKTQLSEPFSSHPISSRQLGVTERIPDHSNYCIVS